ncbi:MAG: ClpXP protease specificity-enhancing factor SspB, partial [Rickettsiales bacterium]|nr:ClpXP protease specificity-enhancing factor SspB [Rickettsiales bacterium]
MMKSKNCVDYSLLMKEAIKNIIKQALGRVGDKKNKNLNYFMAINTEHGGIALPKFLRKKFPKEMGLSMRGISPALNIGEDSFTALVNFNGKEFPLVIPFDALVYFSDKEAEVEFAFDKIAKADDSERINSGAFGEKTKKTTASGADNII